MDRALVICRELDVGAMHRAHCVLIFTNVLKRERLLSTGGPEHDHGQTCTTICDPFLAVSPKTMKSPA